MSPALIETVLAGLNVDRDLRDAITGDLLEGHAAVAAVHGERGADRWMRREMLRSVPVFMLAAVRHGGFRLLAATVGAAFAALVAVGLLIGASVAVVSAMVPPETMGRLAIVAFAIDLSYGAAGGYLAARLGRAAPLGAAFIFGVLCVWLTLMLTGDTRSWYPLALEFLLIPATVSGGWLHARRLARRGGAA